MTIYKLTIILMLASGQFYALDDKSPKVYAVSRAICEERAIAATEQIMSILGDVEIISASHSCKLVKGFPL